MTGFRKKDEGYYGFTLRQYYLGNHILITENGEIKPMKLEKLTCPSCGAANDYENSQPMSAKPMIDFSKYGHRTERG